MKLFTSLLSALALLFMTSLVLAQGSGPTQYRVDNINALLQITLFGSDAKVAAWVGGESARDDGLGGMFFYDGNSSAATNVYAVFKPVNNNGRWWKLPTSVAYQTAAVTVATDTTYAWKLLRGAGATNFMGFGADNNIAYIQTFNGKNLHVQNLGNDVVFNGAGTGGAIIGNTLVVTNATTLQSTLAVGGGTAIKAIYTGNAQINFPAIEPNGVTNMTLTVTGAGTNSSVAVSVTDGAGTAGITISGFVSATNTVTVRAANPTVNNIDPGANVSYRAVVFQY